MGYFDSKLGKKNTPSAAEQPKAPATSSPNSKPADKSALFASRLGQKPEQNTLVESDTAPRQDTLVEPQKTCPLCKGNLQAVDRLWHCQGRCKSRWLLDVEGRWQDVAALPYGICICCETAQALVQGDLSPICPNTGEAHLRLPDGRSILASDAPNGLCQCCLPPTPLAWAEQMLICPSKPQKHYQRLHGQIILLPSEQNKTAGEATAQAIDEALRKNIAKITTNGLFDFD